MRKFICSIALVSVVSASPVMADGASREENIGVGSGALIGAIAGGPVGLIVGAAFGAKLGDTMHRKNDSIESLSDSLQSSRRDLDSVHAELERVQQVARPDLINMLETGIATDLLFRTDEHVLVDTTGKRLQSLAGMLAAMPDISVQLDGFADERGDESYNLRLSEQRVAFVRSELVAAGVHPSRIQVAAHGEVEAEDATSDSYALERRVSLTLFLDDMKAVAQLPD